MKNIEDIIKILQDNNEDIVKLLNWKEVSKLPNLPKEFIDKYKDNLDKYNLIAFQNLSEDILEYYILNTGMQKKKGLVTHILYKQKLSYPFIEKHIINSKSDSIIAYLSKYQELSEEFIEKHFNKLYLENIFESQKLSNAFIEKHIDIIIKNEIRCSLHNKNINESAIIYIYKELVKNNIPIQYSYLFFSISFSIEFLNNFENIFSQTAHKECLTYIFKFQNFNIGFLKKYIDDFKYKYILENMKLDKEVRQYIVDHLSIL